MVQQQRAAETRETLVNAAATVFGRQGYRATTLRDITKEAGVTQGALYFHFESKRELAEEVIRRQHAMSSEIGSPFLTSSESGLASVVRLSGRLANQILTEPIVQAGLRLSTESADELAGASEAPYREWIAACRTLLERAGEAGETRPDLALDVAAELVIAAFTGTQFVSAAVAGSADLFDRLGRMWPLLLVGIARDPGHPAISSASSLILDSSPEGTPA